MQPALRLAMDNDRPDRAAPAPASDEGQRPAGQGWLAAIRARFGLGEPQAARAALEEALRDEAGVSSFPAGEREMLLRLLQFGASRVEDIMVQRADIIAIEENAPLRDLLEMFESSGVSRVPVYCGTLDEPRDMIHIKDLFRWLMAEARTPSADETPPQGEAALDSRRLDLSKPVRAADIRRPMLYVPPSMMAPDLLIRMRAKHIHMALVVDEYGGTDGLVTIEDLVEQIVGDIEDEHDEAEAAHIATDPRLGILASARTPIGEIEAYLGVKLLAPGEEESVDTLGGLVVSIAGGVPARGARARHESGLEFEVLDADQRRVKKLRVILPPEAAAARGAPRAAAPARNA